MAQSKSLKRPLTGFLNPEASIRTVRVSVPAAAAAVAEQFGRDHARRKLETVLAAFVADLAVGAARPRAGGVERGTAWLGSHVWEVELPDAPRLREEEVLDSPSADCPWYDWEKWARAQGVPADLAMLGRDVMRAAWVDTWPPEVRAVCGWRDDGRGMRRLARRRPDLAQRRWSQWLNSQGGQVDPQTGARL
jgi:hypothetical protein